MSSKTKIKPVLLLFAALICLLATNIPSIGAEQTIQTATVQSLNNLDSKKNDIGSSSASSTDTKPKGDTPAPAATTTTLTTVAPPVYPNKTPYCFNEGTQLPNSTVCKCVGDFFGDRCDYVVCNKEIDGQCANGGVCLEHHSRNQSMLTKCQCPPTFKGVLCEQPVCMDYCKNDGRCDDGLGSEYEFHVNSTLVATLTCECRSTRFVGKQCQFDKCKPKIEHEKSNCYMNASCKYLCDEECDKTYCLGNGKCVTGSNKQLACECKPLFSGPTCAISDCKDYCFNSGTCFLANNTRLECACSADYEGERCSTPMKKSESSPSKSGSGGASTMRRVIYAFTFILTICLVGIAVYYLAQNNRGLGVLDRFKSGGSSASGSADSSPSRGSGRSFFRTNFSFNKLDDQQAITQHDELDQTDTV